VARQPQQRRERLAPVRVVLDHQDAAAGEGGGRRRRCRRPQLRGRDRQGDREARPAPEPFARGRDLAAVQVDDAARERQPDAEAALRARERRVRLDEQVEDRGQVLARDADPVVLHLDLGRAVVPLQRHPDPTARGRVLARVVQQVPDHLLQARGVAQHRHRPVGQRERQVLSLPLERRPMGFHRLRDRLAQVERLRAQADAAARDARDVQQVVEQPRHVPRLAVDHGDRPPRRLVEPPVLFQDLGRVDDRAKRVAQLVREHGQELVLLAVRGLGLGAGGVRLGARRALAGEGGRGGPLGIHPRQAERDVASDRLGQAALVGRERSRRLRVDHELPDQPAPGTRSARTAAPGSPRPG
jgi:hypothetical protein